MIVKSQPVDDLTEYQRYLGRDEDQGNKKCSKKGTFCSVLKFKKNEAGKINVTILLHMFDANS